MWTPFYAATSIARPFESLATVTYYNCGDWVESCSALVEGEDGIISLVNYDPFMTSRPAASRTSRFAATARNVCSLKCLRNRRNRGSH